MQRMPEVNQMEPGLYIVGTPIGNLEDLSPRALDCLRNAALILAEDTRHTRKLLSRFEFQTPMLSYHKFNEAQRVEQIVRRIQQGEALALVSDSGMPGISDPGSRVVQAVREAGLPSYVVPGPSAVTSAVALSGWGSAGFVFAGFLPPKGEKRRTRILGLMEAGLPVVLFESTHRILRLLEDLNETVPEQEIFLARELTKKFEETRWGFPAALMETASTLETRGEWVVIVSARGKRKEYST